MINPIQNQVPKIVPKNEQLSPELQNNSDTSQDQIETISSRPQKKSTQEVILEVDKQKAIATANQKVDFSKVEQKLAASVDNSVTMKFSFDKDSKELILQVLDADSKKVIRQFPSELAIQIARMVDEILEQGQVTDATI
jgi:flagellar protein FlaG